MHILHTLLCVSPPPLASQAVLVEIALVLVRERARRPR